MNRRAAVCGVAGIDSFLHDFGNLSCIIMDADRPVAMSLPTSEPIPDDTMNLPPARRRREGRHLAPHGQGDRAERAAFLDNLAVRSIPSFDFFLFSFISGLVFGIGFILNSPAVTVVAAVLAPFLGPLVGISLATIVGSGRFFLKSLVCSLIGTGLAFFGGFLMGYAPGFIPGLPVASGWLTSQVSLTWPSLGALALVVIMAIVTFVHDDHKTFVPGAGLAYLLYLPLAAAGFGLSAGIETAWPSSLVTFAVHLSLAVLLGIVMLAILGLRPLTIFGYSLGTTIALSSVVLLVAFGSMGTIIHDQKTIPVVLPTPITPTATKPTSTATPVPPTVTSTRIPSPTNTLIPSPTNTITITPAPTPVWAMIYAQSLNGAYVRAEPRIGGKIITSLLNGTLVKVLPDVVQDGGTIWAHIQTNDGISGWVVQSLLVTATPVPAW